MGGRGGGPVVGDGVTGADVGCGDTVGVGGSVAQNSASPALKSLHTTFLIHPCPELVRAYTPGFLGAAQPYPQETTPTCSSTNLPSPEYVRLTMGPPESPWQESIPPSSMPAQSISS